MAAVSHAWGIISTFSIHFATCTSLKQMNKRCLLQPLMVKKTWFTAATNGKNTWFIAPFSPSVYTALVDYRPYLKLELMFPSERDTERKRKRKRKRETERKR
jgi:hypothetical protein